MKIILASTSKYRRELLERLNISFEVVAPNVDEDSLKKIAPVSLPDLPLFLAQKKAESLITTHPNDFIIGCDQMGICEGRALNKAHTKDKAIQQLLSLQGKTHRLITAMAIHFKNQWNLSTDITELTMRPLSEDEIRHYVELENPIDCAGSYKIEGLGISLFSEVKTKDPTAIIGLSLIQLTSELKKL